VLANQFLQPEQAGVAEYIGTDFALLEVGQEDSVDAARQETGQAGLAHRQRQASEIRAIAHQEVEGVELDLGIVSARVQGVENRTGHQRRAERPRHRSLQDGARRLRVEAGSRLYPSTSAAKIATSLRSVSIGFFKTRPFEPLAAYRGMRWSDTSKNQANPVTPSNASMSESGPGRVETFFVPQ